jgi:hypothetical protein
MIRFGCTLLSLVSLHSLLEVLDTETCEKDFKCAMERFVK